jgi:hypothetical protein
MMHKLHLHIYICLIRSPRVSNTSKYMQLPKTSRRSNKNLTTSRKQMKLAAMQFVENYEEKEELNQYWYSDSTIEVPFKN